jgi:hypothetical protein
LSKLGSEDKNRWFHEVRSPKNADVASGEWMGSKPSPN